jgi:hypothetical protein
MTTQVAFMDKTGGMLRSFEKLYNTGAILSFANLFLALLLIFKADWITDKIIKSDYEIKIDITAKSIMKIVIATIGILYCASTLYYASTKIESIISLFYGGKDVNKLRIIGILVGYLLKAVIGISFILKSEQLANFAMGRLKNKSNPSDIFDKK